MTGQKISRLSALITEHWGQEPWAERIRQRLVAAGKSAAQAEAEFRQRAHHFYFDQVAIPTNSADGKATTQPPAPRSTQRLSTGNPNAIGQAHVETTRSTSRLSTGRVRAQSSLARERIAEFCMRCRYNPAQYERYSSVQCDHPLLRSRCGQRDGPYQTAIEDPDMRCPYPQGWGAATGEMRASSRATEAGQ